MKTIPKVINSNGLVKLLCEKFEKENKQLYNLYDYKKAKQKYIYFMLGTYKPKQVNENEVIVRR